ncbi:reverse transcriptase [Gossypium australe]|uniref:Reverse transcriptase n=1 Tax=Gossypium australe TaxID=47621 RepID=A0A5B6V483_9ROSI|nr:reverse transcriptase [Gossypium australe]
METKVTSKRMESIRRKCGFLNGIDVAATGTRGGLSLGWKEGLNLTLKSFSNYHIDVEVEDEDEVDTWRFTGFYAVPVENERKESWKLLRALKRRNDKPWIITGDFNEILFSFEKKRGRTREERQMAAFRETLEHCELYDLGFSGQWYTWERGRLVDNNIRERLDRGVANTEWWNLFPRYKVSHLQHSFSDHYPIVVDTCGMEELRGEVQQPQRLKAYRTEELNDRLLKLGAGEINNATLEEITNTKLELNFEADKEELFWEQRARVNWLRMGDRNMAFFHRSATHRKRKNLIKKLKNEVGSLVTKTDAIHNLATVYFKEMFLSKEVSNCDRLIESFFPSITDEHNNMLMAAFREEEVAEAIKSIAPLKASGKDGFPALFYQKYWHIVGEEVTRYCLEVLNGRRNIDEINKTSIVLIPKEKSPKTLNKFRPISLCNVIYKIISKVLVQRFRKVLDLCIKDTQGAFVAGRQITDNIFVAYKVLHSLKRRRGGSKKSFALKLDMSKAYDRIEWSFLEKNVAWYGVTYTVVINGKHGEEFKPQRGLRQGDPLSPYLFLICTEGFSRLIELAKKEKRLSGIRMGRGNVSASHLFFVDDSVLFGEASEEGANNMKCVVQEYEKISGQLVNFDKSLIYFSGNVDLETKTQVGRILGVRISNNPEKYLGLPTMVGRRKKHAFVEIKEHCVKLLSSWSMRFLSSGGKEVFLKSVLQAIPIYAMQCFKLPISFCHNLRDL